MADDGKQQDKEPRVTPSVTPDETQPAPGAPDPATSPIQIASPAEWGPFAPPPVPGRLGQRPLPDLEPISVPRRKAGPSFERPAGETRPSPKPRASPPQPAPVSPAKKRKPLWRRILGWIVKLLLAFLLLSVAMVVLYRFVGPPVTWTMIGDVIGGHGVTKRWMPLSRIDPSMARAAIAAEDARFCEHKGFDFKAIAAAAARNATGTKVIRGGSTISQQTAKNVFLWQGGGYFRKGLEAYFTVLIENIWGKRRIMEVYLNVAETGIGTYGVNAGSMRYFKHDASRLSAREAAQIAAVLPLPKKRAAIDPKGFTRRYGNSITARIGVVRGDGLDACLR
ncbi:MAG: monofunctional biosynthetic peptidoglycan transglycosylase [Sphingomonadales bacterium]|nr:MAG: monofunctional biosynthetic peptidoglycan transglycosylase [Sphingomonadales bacterium]